MHFSQAIATALLSAMPVIAAPVPTPMSMSSKQSQMVSPDLIRAAQASEPVAIKDVKSHDLTCGRGASVQHQDHPVAIDAGTQLQMQWSDDWKHSIGPIMTYLAACVDNDCAQSDVTTLEWFKIDQKAADASGAWWQSELDTQRIYVPIPAALREGNYIVRHEVIVLDQDPVLFFPACAALNVRNQNQVEVEGVETYPSSNFTVEIPGAYGEDDEGLQSVDEAFDAHSYVFPGPPVWQPDVDGLVESASSDGFYEAAEMDVEMAGDAYQVQFLAPNITSSVEFVSSTATTLMPTMTVESVSSTTSSTSTGTATATPSPTPYHAQLSPLPTDINHGESGGEAEDGPSYDDGSWNPTKYD
ncbi:Cellulose-growth-specific protein [Wallemia ichthyophaga EXF-994]|uniref:AA9 family lytic polysaccharide monooxygenase n=1 Tax=Wallemia ichthyophaga (strain EXF-994 / CBS 113033) TaxID=1299270 RepID=R9AG64_WALI9|nr:Cellulose-growth-specific protein [Wallemia ichthyophaga EXF-994]EOR01204.1 Cellulose-growth-specific protein [Wallemia ichthyophaga EXF-994]